MLGIPRRYAGDHLNRVAFPMGGIGAGMVCLEGIGTLSHISVRNHPDIFNEPCIFAAFAIHGETAAPRDWSGVTTRILEGPVPSWKIYGRPGCGEGDVSTSYGMPRFANAEFSARFPFGTVTLTDDTLPVTAHVTGWSPFIPGDPDNSSLPVAALEYRLVNRTAKPLTAMFSFNSRSFMGGTIAATPGGFVLGDTNGTFHVAVDDPAAQVNYAWHRGAWWDHVVLAWRDISSGKAVPRPPVTEGEPPHGTSIYVPVSLAPHGEQTIRVRLSWYVPTSTLRIGTDPGQPGEPADKSTPDKPTADKPTYVPWYAGRFHSQDAVATYWRDQYTNLRRATAQFTDTLYDTSLPPDVIDAVASNLVILKSPTVLRQTDGRLWMWEGSGDSKGLGDGSCTHVWNYAQATAHLFPSLERTLRETEFGPSQDEHGYQMFRAALPIRPRTHELPAASDGQLGGIMKVYRDWRISGDTTWVRTLWPKVRASLDYCIATWDAAHEGWLTAPHHNTYDIEFSGPDGMCTSFYLGALHAAVLIGTALGDNVTTYQEILSRGVSRIEQTLFNGEYFIQQVRPHSGPASILFDAKPSPEDEAFVAQHGPKYQYGTGCLSDGIMGDWMARVCHLGPVIDQAKVTSHVRAVHRYNFRRDFTTHVDVQRPSYAIGHDAGLLLCTWPRGDRPLLPFIYADEAWTGIEYQVASHLMLLGHAAEGVEVVGASRGRYDGRVRNPFDEYEYGHWYGRALASYALLQGMTGARYDAVDKTLYIQPSIPGDFHAFLATSSGYGTVGVRHGKPFLTIVAGTIDVRSMRYVPYTHT